MADIYCIRHAESEMNLKPYLVGGRSNHALLTPRGVEQAVLLGKRLRKEGIHFDKVYSSPAVRAVETARGVCREIGFSLDDIVLCDALMELDQGKWQGAVRKEVYTPEVYRVIDADNWNFRSPGGESPKEVEERMYGCVEKIVQGLPPDAKVAVFSHGVAIKCLLRRIMDFSPNMTYRISLDNTAITLISYVDGRWYPRKINDSSHLRREEVEYNCAMYIRYAAR
jgi:probable phosphoglycerate mutase